MANNYDLPIPDVIKRNPVELEKLRQAFGYFYDEESKVNVIYQSPPDARFQTVTQFVDYLNSSSIGIPKGTSAKQIGIILERWYENITKAPEYGKPTVSETVPDAELRRSQEEERQKREIAAKESAANAKRNVENALKRQKELHDQIKEKQLYRQVVSPSPAPLDAAKLQSYDTLSKQAGANPVQFTDELADEIQKRLSARAPEGLNEEIEYLSKEAALGVTKNLRGESPAVEAATLYQLAQQKEYIKDISPENSEDISRSLDNIMSLEIAKYQEQRRTVAAAFGEDFADSFYGPKDLNGIQVQFSKEKGSGYSDYKLGNITKSNIDFLTRQDDLFGYVQSNGTQGFKSYFLKQAGKFVESQIPKSALLSKAFESAAVRSAFNIYVMGDPLVYTNLVGRIALETGHGPFLAWLGEVSGINFGVAAASTYIGATLAPEIYASAAIYAEATTTIALTGGTFAGEAFAGGAGVALDFATTTGFTGYSAATTTFAAGGVSTLAGAEAAGIGAVTTTAVSTATGTAVAGATGAAAGTAGAAAGAAAGSAVFPVVGTLIGAVAGLITGVLLPKLKGVFQKFPKSATTMGGAALGGLIAYVTGFGAISGALVGGFGTFAVGSFATGGVSGVTGAMSGVARSAAFGARLVLSSFMAGVGGPLIAMLIGFPILVAFILLVINTGAYLVPPGKLSSEQAADNPYMLVTKKAEPNKIPNPSGKVTVTYTVTIEALKDTLTNIAITNTECRVIKKDGGKVDCPIENIPEIPTDLVVSVSSPYSFTFTADYNSQFNDSLVHDTVEIQADTPNVNDVTTSGSASLCIGDCAIACVQVSNNGGAWPSNLRSNAEGAVADIMGRYPKFMARVCPSQTEVNLCYKPSEISAGYYAWHIHHFTTGDKCDVYFNEKGMKSVKDATMLITHEITHHVQSIDGKSKIEYRSSGAWSEIEGKGFCSYGATRSSDTEGMAEALGLFTGIPSWVSCISSYSKQYPVNYNFAQGFMN